MSDEEYEAELARLQKKQKDTQTAATVLGTAGTAAQLIPGVGTVIGGVLMGAGAITGAVGSSKAKKELAELEKNKVNIGVPSSIKEYVNSPVSEKYLQQIADQASQRVGTSINALQKGGLASMGKLPMLMQNEARNDMALQADLADRSKQALLVGGQYEARSQDAARKDWEQQMQGEQARRAEGQKYMWSALNEMGRLGMATDWDSLGGEEGSSEDNNGYSVKKQARIDGRIERRQARQDKKTSYNDDYINLFDGGYNLPTTFG